MGPFWIQLSLVGRPSTVLRFYLSAHSGACFLLASARPNWDIFNHCPDCISQWSFVPVKVHTHAGMLGTLTLFLPGCHFIVCCITESWSWRIILFSDNFFLELAICFCFILAWKWKYNRIFVMRRRISENLVPRTSLSKIVFWTITSLCNTVAASRQPQKSVLNSFSLAVTTSIVQRYSIWALPAVMLAIAHPHTLCRLWKCSSLHP